MSVRALRAALERIAALLVACVARHTALLTPCPAPQTNPHHPHTHMKTALSFSRSKRQFHRLLIEAKIGAYVTVNHAPAWNVQAEDGVASAVSPERRAAVAACQFSACSANPWRHWCSAGASSDANGSLPCAITCCVRGLTLQHKL